MHFIHIYTISTIIFTLIIVEKVFCRLESNHQFSNNNNNHQQLARTSTPLIINNWKDAAKILNEKDQCTPYNYPGMNEIIHKFPKVWEIAEILPDDEKAREKFKEIQQSGLIPKDVKQKGFGGSGDFKNVTQNYPSSDPDCWFTLHNCVIPKHKSILPDVWQCPEPNTWGLTFDDGPNCTHNIFYDFLQKSKQKASLFYIGSNLMDWPAQGQRGVADGHHICVHTWSHKYMTQLTDEQVFAELYYTGKAIKEILGITVECWRPPYGDVDDRVRAIAQGLGMITTLWSEDTDDWEVEPMGRKPISQIKQNYMDIINKNYSTNGNIVLTHEIDSETMNEMMKMYPTIKKHFKHIVPITACMNQSKPYQEENIQFPIFNQYIKGEIEPKGYPDMNNFKIANSPYSPKPIRSNSSFNSNGYNDDHTESYNGSNSLLTSYSSSTSFIGLIITLIVIAFM